MERLKKGPILEVPETENKTKRNKKKPMKAQAS
jgi:hypothetical protein